MFFWITKKETLISVAQKIQLHNWIHTSSSTASEMRFKHRVFTGMLLKVALDAVDLGKVLITCERTVLYDPQPEVKIEEPEIEVKETVYDPFKELRIELLDYGIIIGKPLSGGACNFSFEGTEEQFVLNLTLFMKQCG